MTGSEPSLGDVVMLGFLLLSVNRSEDASLKRVVLHLTKDATLLDSESSTWDLSVVSLPCKVPWCSTVFKQ